MSPRVRETGPAPPTKKLPNFSMGTADFSTCAGHTTGSTHIAAQSFSSPSTAFCPCSPPVPVPSPCHGRTCPHGRGAHSAGMRSPWSSVGALEPQWLRVDWSPFPHTKVLADFGGRRGRPGVAPEAFFRGPISGQRNKHILLYWLWARFFIIPPPG